MSERHRRRTAAAAAALALLAAGCTGTDPEPTADPTAPPTPLASYDTTGVALARAPYCDRVPSAAVEEALDAPTARSSTHDNGDRIRLADGGKDVAHEYGCTWSAGASRAWTWLFAPPVTGEQARGFVREATAAAGCTADDRAPAFGTPSVALVCTGKTTVSASYRGLFGDAWLVCEIEMKKAGANGDGALLQRAGHWCVQVLEAATEGLATPVSG